jgi:glycosyltransferase involved in cell wall biosynthesis
MWFDTEAAIRLLLANNRYFLSGGPERYLFSVEAALRARGHEPTPFALAYARNEPSAAASFFPPPPVDEEFVQHGDRALSFVEKLRLAGRVVRDRRVYDAARRIIADRRIDVVYALQIAHYLYPDVLFAARDAGVPVVMRLSDYQLVCPAYNCLRDGRPCFDCRDSLAPGLIHRCLKGSLGITAVRELAMVYAKCRGALDAVRYFISPSRHLIDVLRDAGFAPDRLLHVPTPIALPPDPGPPPADGPLLFVGGLYEAKGAHVAVDAVRGTGRTLRIAGDADTPYGRALRHAVERDRGVDVRFVGFTSGDALDALYAQASAALLPSLWWENVPHVALEAMARRRPVIASNLGSLPEIVAHGKTGLLFDPGDAASLRQRIAELARSGQGDQFGQAGRAAIAAQHDPQAHVERLEAIFAECVR